jgi:hypothetical protein
LAIAVLVAAAEEPSDWIGRHVIPLRTVEAKHGCDDLQPLGPVAKWFAKPRATRSIGALYSEDSASYLRQPWQDAFDVILLVVEKTTVSRPVQKVAWMADLDGARGFSTAGA